MHSDKNSGEPRRSDAHLMGAGFALCDGKLRDFGRVLSCVWGEGAMKKIEIYHPYTILVAVDYSGTSVDALDRAIAIAADRANCELHVITVLRREDEHLGEDYRVSVEAEHCLLKAEQELAAYVDEALVERAHRGGAAPVGIRLHIAGGKPALHIAQLAADLRADLIMVGTHGRSGVKRMVLGSVAEGVLRMAHCPVLVARPVDYVGVERAPDLDPPCPDCFATRSHSHGAELWCVEHQARYNRWHSSHIGGRSTPIPKAGGTASIWRY